MSPTWAPGLEPRVRGLTPLQQPIAPTAVGCSPEVPSALTIHLRWVPASHQLQGQKLRVLLSPHPALRARGPPGARSLARSAETRLSSCPCAPSLTLPPTRPEEPHPSVSWKLAWKLFRAPREDARVTPGSSPCFLPSRASVESGPAAAALGAGRSRTRRVACGVRPRDSRPGGAGLASSPARRESDQTVVSISSSSDISWSNQKLFVAMCLFPR